MKFDFCYTIHCDDSIPRRMVPGHSIRYVGDQPGEEMPVLMIAQMCDGLMDALSHVLAALSDNEKHIDDFVKDYFPARMKPLIMRAMKERQSGGKASYRRPSQLNSRIDVNELVELFSGSGKTRGEDDA